jgi:hypothetical protein
MIARFIDTRHRLAKAGGAAKAMALLTLTGWAAGFAISAHALTPADNREIQRFTLTESFLHRRRPQSDERRFRRLARSRKDHDIVRLDDR